MQVKGKKIILFTGGTGFLGSFLSAEFLREGYTIFFLVRPKYGKKERKRIIEQLEAVGLEQRFFYQIHIIRGDVTKSLCNISDDWIKKYNGEISEIWHLAGLVVLHKTEELSSVNLGGVKNILTLTQKLSCRLHYISTAYVAGDLKDEEIFEDELKTPLNFRNLYEESKFESEKLIRDYTVSGKITSTIYRPSILIGHSQSGQAFSFTGYYVPLFFIYNFKKFLNRHKFLSYIPIFIPYVKYATLNLIPIDLAVRFIINISKSPHSKNKIFHIVHPNPSSVKFIFKVTIQKLGYKKVKFIKVSRGTLEIIGNILSLFSYFFGSSGTRLRRQLINYLDYLTDTRKFSTKNVQTLVGNLTEIPQIDKGLLNRCINYAIAKNFRNSIF